MKIRNKTLATWLALLFGALGAHRIYLKGMQDWLVWILLSLSALAVLGYFRSQALGTDDRISWLLIPLLGISIGIACVQGIYYALMPAEKWAARYGAGDGAKTDWRTITAAAFCLLFGVAAFMSSLVYGLQRVFEWLR